MSIQDRVRDELQAEGARLIPGNGNVASVMRGRRRRRLIERTAVGLAVLAAVAAPFVLHQDRGTGPHPIASPCPSDGPPPPTRSQRQSCGSPAPNPCSWSATTWSSTVPVRLDRLMYISLDRPIPSIVFDVSNPFDVMS